MLGARLLSELGKWNWPLLLTELTGGSDGVVVVVVVLLVMADGGAPAVAVFVVGVPGKRSPLILTVSRLLQ